MIGRLSLPVALLTACCAISAQAAPGDPATESGAVESAAGASAKPVAAASRAGSKRAKDPAAASARTKAGARALREIHIEGEIPVPQVLFITARDQRRVLDFNHRRYLKTSLELGRSTVLPTSVVVVTQP